ncbi:MAG: bifunctional (p)ppGpp synthetase/guanosine-3',5'-bis(diphosphate) 3'-pyrophosphohydrolase [Hyphomicrobiaceae bacterium]
MMRQYELVERVQSYDPTADEALLNRAYVYAMKAHGNQKRASGDPYFSHPLEVAAILTELKLDDATIVAALLHDVIEDTETTRAEIDALFSPEIGALVEGLTKIKRLDLVSKRAEQAENFRKLLVAISSDIRVLLVKLADRLHNMRTIEHMKPGSRQRISQETIDIYAPLAGRMGMQWLRDELEDLAFRWLNPDAYRTVVGRLETLRQRNSNLVDEIRKALEAKLAEVRIPAEVSGREKKPYSIWRKMENKQISLEQLSDIYAFRVIVGSGDDCYRVLGVAHTTWRAVPGRFKDYISNPKQNDYRSIHTTIVGPRHQRVEMQIRTRQMHEIAEYGVAAHSLYKDPGEAPAGNRTRPQDSNPYQWLRRLVETLLEGDNPEEFLEHTKLELFHDQVFCFTPKGRLIALPRGATPIDFAYAVHTDVGNSCVGALVNGRQRPLISSLRNGDEVEIITSKAQTPPAAWERIAVTGKARSAIRRASREALRRQYSELGRRLVATAFERAGAGYTDDLLKKGLHRLTQKSVEEALSAVGRGELSTADVVRAVLPGATLSEAAQHPHRSRNRLERPAADEGWFNLTKVIGLKFRWPGRSHGDAAPTGQGVPIRGVKGDVPVEFGESGAVPGDRIVGIMTPGTGIRIYPIHSPKLTEYDEQPERWIDVTWDIDENSMDRFPARITVSAKNEPGSLAQIAQVIGEAGGNIDNLRMVERGADYTEMMIELEVWDLKHLNEIIAGLRAKPMVNRVERQFE